MFVHMQEDVEKTVGHKFKLGHLILTDTRKASQDSVIMHCDTDHDGRVGVQFMSPGGWRELSIGMGFICLLYTSPSPRDATLSRMPSSA